jgi:LPXTG-motif cell wall-anchored protein
MNSQTAVVHGRRRSTALKAFVVTAGVLMMLMLGFQSASARTISAYPPPPPPSTSLQSGGSSDPSSPPLVTKALASTGSDVALIINVSGALLVLGGVALYVARRRSA